MAAKSKAELAEVTTVEERLAQLAVNMDDSMATPRDKAEYAREITAIKSVQALAAGDIELAAALAPAWMGGVGEVIEGTIVTIDKGTFTPERGEAYDYPIIAIRTTPKNGEHEMVWLIHAIPAVLLNQLREMKPGPGDKLSVVSLGPRVTRSGDNPYHLYKLLTRGQATRSYEW